MDKKYYVLETRVTVTRRELLTPLPEEKMEELLNDYVDQYELEGMLEQKGVEIVEIYNVELLDSETNKTITNIRS